MPQDDASISLPGPFTVSIADNPAHAIRFDRGEIYFGARLLTPAEQKKLLADYVGSYTNIRKRNYGWCFLSSCNNYFNGQLQEIKNFKTDEQKIRYLFCHAERKPVSKTAEALRNILPLFCSQLIAPPRPPDIQYNRKKISHFVSDPVYQATLKKLDQKPVRYLHNFANYMGWTEEAFAMIWRQPIVSRVASVDFLGGWFGCSVVFCDEACMGDLMPVEKAEILWVKKLYCSLVHFRHLIDKSNGLTNEIHIAFNELIRQVDLDPSENDLALLKETDFYDAVINVRLQLMVVHNSWINSVFDTKVMVNRISVR